MNVYEEVLEKLIKNEMKISFVESCTGGMLTSSLVSVPGASKVLEESYVTYSENAKKKIVNVKQDTLDKYTVYSKEVATEMVEGLYELSLSDVCVAITGQCGSGNAFDGSAYVAIICNKVLTNYHINASGTREEIRTFFVKKVFEILKNIL